MPVPSLVNFPGPTIEPDKVNISDAVMALLPFNVTVPENVLSPARLLKPPLFITTFLLSVV